MPVLPTYEELLAEEKAKKKPIRDIPTFEELVAQEEARAPVKVKKPQIPTFEELQRRELQRRPTPTLPTYDELTKMPDKGEALVEEAIRRDREKQNLRRWNRLIKIQSNPLVPPRVKKAMAERLKEYPAALQAPPSTALDLVKRGEPVPVITGSRRVVGKFPLGLAGVPKERKTKEGIPIEIIGQEKPKKPSEKEKALLHPKAIEYREGKRGRYEVETATSSGIPVWVRDWSTGELLLSPQAAAVKSGKMPPDINPKDRKEILLLATTAEEARSQLAREGWEKSGLGALFQILDIPFRAAGGMAKGVWENVIYGAAELARELGAYKGKPLKQLSPDAPFVKAWESVTGKDPTYISDVTQQMARDALGRDLTKGEAIAASAAGLIAELFVLPKFFPRWGGLPATPTAARQMERALAKAGARGVSRETLGKAAKYVMETEMPRRIHAGRRLVREIAKRAGGDPEKADFFFRKIIGRQGENLGRSGLHFGAMGREIIPSPGTFRKSEVLVGKEIAGMGLGSPKFPGLAKASEAISWGAGLPPGAVDAMRKVDAERIRFELAAEKGMKHLEYLAREPGLKGAFRKLSGAQKAALLADWEFVRSTQLPKEINYLKRVAAERALLEEKIKRFEQARDRLKAAISKIRSKERYTVKNLPSWIINRGEGITKKAEEFVSVSREFERKSAELARLRRSFAAVKTEAKKNEIKEAIDALRREIKPIRQRLRALQRRLGPQTTRYIQESYRKAFQYGQHGKTKKLYEKMLANIDESLKKAKTSLKKKPELEELESSIEAKRLGFEEIKKRMLKAGLTKEELEKGLDALTPDQRLAVQLVKTNRKQLYRRMVQEGVDVNELPESIARISKKPGLTRKVYQWLTGTEEKVWPERFTKSGVSGAYRPQKHRLGVEAGISLAGAPKREFINDLSKIYAAETLAASHKIATARMENTLLSLYGRPITSEAAMNALEKSGGLAGKKVYLATAGRFKGKRFVVDAEIADHLQRITDPKALDRALRTMDKYMAWWKIQATLTRPGFVVRNLFGGNMWQMYLADVSPDSFGQALRILAKHYSKSPFGGYLPGRAWLDRFFNVDILRGGEKPIAGKPVEWWLERAYQNKVFGGGFFGSELAAAGRPGATVAKDIARGLNIFGSHSYITRAVKLANTAAEDATRLAIFIDRLKKGYTEAEAAAAVAKYIFNYDEVSRALKSLRQFQPFATWPWKNYGLEMWALLNRPGKIAAYARTKGFIRSLDPPTPEEMIIESYMNQEEKEYQAIERVPYARDEKGTRLYLPLGGLLPPEELRKLEPRFFLRAFVEMLHPIFRVIPKIMGKQERKLRFHPFGHPGDYRDAGLVYAPTPIKMIMNYAQQRNKRVYNFLKNTLFRPQYNELIHKQKLGEALKRGMSPGEAFKYADERTPIVNWMWRRDIEQYVTAFDPALAKLLSILRSKTEIEEYDRLKSWAVGIKPFPFGLKQAQYEYADYLIDLFDETIQNILKEERQTGRYGINLKLLLEETEEEEK